MEVVFHLIVEWIKISMLASVYATLILLVFRLIGRCKPNGWCNSVTKNKTRCWLLSGCIISVGLFVYMSTYWGNHGIGDSAQVPIGHFKKGRQINGVDSYIQNSEGEQLGIAYFAFGNSRLYAETQRELSGGKGDFVVWDLQNDHWTFYKTKADYLIAAGQKDYPSPDRLSHLKIITSDIGTDGDSGCCPEWRGADLLVRHWLFYWWIPDAKTYHISKLGLK